MNKASKPDGFRDLFQDFLDSLLDERLDKQPDRDHGRPRYERIDIGRTPGTDRRGAELAELVRGRRVERSQLYRIGAQHLEVLHRSPTGEFDRLGVWDAGYRRRLRRLGCAGLGARWGGGTAEVAYVSGRLPTRSGFAATFTVAARAAAATTVTLRHEAVSPLYDPLI